jgi:hypothetical protein
MTTTDAALFAMSRAAKNLTEILTKADRHHAEIATESRLGLTAIQSNKQWILPIITGIKTQIQRIEIVGGRLTLTWLSDDGDVEGYKIASAAAQRAATQQTREMRSTSLSFLKQAIKERWKAATKVNKQIKHAKKSTMARYLQLKCGHATTGAHLLRIGKAQDAQCWWCGQSSQTVSHLLLECRKWRRQRDSMLQKLRVRKVSVGGGRDPAGLKILPSDEAMTDVPQFIQDTDVGKKPAGDANNSDSWDIERLDRSTDEEDVVIKNERG